MRVVVVLAIVGHFLRMFALAFVAPLGFAVVTGHWESALDFAVGLIATLAFGFMFAPVKASERRVLHRAEALAVVAATWFSIALFGAIPYFMAGMTFVDAFFESMSGFTTTGATVVTDFTYFDQPFFLWRAMSQWFGGLGVVALFVVILPRLGIAGRQLFFAEASGAPGEAVSPQVRSAAGRLWILYVGLTVLAFVLLLVVGFDPYNAICHALTTIPAGGFSPHPESIMGFANPAAEWIITAFMVVAGISFPLLYVSVTRYPLRLLRDTELRFFLFVVVAATVAIALMMMRDDGALDAEDAFRKSAFQVAALISGTGYASTDYNLWGDHLKIVLLMVMIIGGCAGSAAGGPKAIRHLLVGKHLLREFRQVLHPRAVLTIQYKGRAVSDEVMRTIFSLVIIYVGSYFAVGALLTLFGHDLVTAFSSAVATVGNVGPAFNDAGPMGNFAFYGDPEKIIMTLGMWVGRLEIVTVLALFHLDVLRDIHWRRFKG